jgi:RND family efflux transporter MFP subunit
VAFNISKFRVTCLFLPLVAFLGAGGCSSGNAAEADAGNPPTSVAIQTVLQRPISKVLSYTGDVHGEVEIRVYSLIPDRIVSLDVEEGQEVEQGATIAVIRAQSLGQGVQQAMGGLNSARAQVDGLRDNLARQRRLLTSGVVTQAQVDATEIQLRSAEAQVAQLEATVGSARLRQGDSVVRAPLRGIVGQVFVEEGDLAAPQIPICTVVQMDRVEVLIQVPERDLGSIGQGMEAEIRVASASGEVFRAPVSRVSPVVDRASRTATLRIMLDNPSHRLLPGALADVRIEVERIEAAVVVPQYALVLNERTEQEMNYRAYVLRADGQTVEERIVRVGIYDGDDVQVVSGLSAGDRLVVEGQHMLRNESHVQVEGSETENAPAAPGS